MIELITKIGKRLKKLHIICSNISLDNISSSMYRLGQACPILEEFYINTMTNNTVTDISIIGFIQNCSKLQTLILYIHAITDTSITAIAQYCPNLQKISINLSTNFTYTSIIALSERGLPLEELDIPWIPIPSAEIAAQCAHALSRIRTVEFEPNINDSFCWPYMIGQRKLSLKNQLNQANRESILTNVVQHCCQLENITICGSSDVIIQLLIALAKKNPYISSLYLYEATALTDISLIELVKLCPHLRFISISKCSLVTETGIIALSEQCMKLAQQIISNSSWLTDTTILALSVNSKKLFQLSLRECTHLTNNSILALSQHCQRLSCFEIPHSNLITEAAIVELVQQCHQLRYLEVSSDSISDETIEQLETQRSSDGNLYLAGYSPLTISIHSPIYEF